MTNEWLLTIEHDGVIQRVPLDPVSVYFIQRLRTGLPALGGGTDEELNSYYVTVEGAQSQLGRELLDLVLRSLNRELARGE